MTEARDYAAATTMAIAPPGPVWVVDLWDGAVPDFGTGLAIQVEPCRWWLFADDTAARALAERLRASGTVTPIGGALLRATLAGPRWREALMFGGCFDAESPGFAVGDSASTLFGHLLVRLHVVSETECRIYITASYRGAIEHHWQAVAAALAAMAPA